MEYRLNRYISSSGYCSRREADEYIEAGQVKVNGRRAKVGDRVYPGQTVMVNGLEIVQDIKPVYIAYNKPVGIVSTTDPNERNNIADAISHEQRIFPIGRLDKDSQGLILLTNDGDIVNKILRAGNKNKKEYIVSVDRPITDDFLERMANGVPILDRVTRKCELVQINPTTFKITLMQGLNRQIRRMCEYFNYNVTRLERIQVMNINLGKLGEGNWRDLTNDELKMLFDLLETAEKTAPTTTPKKRKLSSNERRAAKAAEERALAKELGLDKTNKQSKKVGDDEELAKPKGTRHRTKDPSGERVGKQRSDKLERRTRTRELNAQRRAKKAGKKK